MALVILQVGLIVSIAGIIALSILTLYLLDKLVSRVESVEVTLNEINTKQRELEKPVDEIKTPSGDKIETSVDALETRLNDSYERLKQLVEETATKTKMLGDDLFASNQSMEKLASSASESKERVDVLQRELSLITRRFNEMEDTLTEIIKRSLRST